MTLDRGLPANLKRVYPETINHLKRTYGHSAPLTSRLFYHDDIHTVSVFDRSWRIMEVLLAHHAEVEARSLELLLVGALFHDLRQITYIDWNIAKPPVRQRLVGLSEQLSADDCAAWMEQVEKYSPSEIEQVRLSILGTEAAWSSEHNTVIHPHLNADSPLIARVLALADVNGAGLDGPAVAVDDSLCLLLENRPDFPIDDLEAAAIKESDQPAYIKAVQDWLGSQVGFITGRWQLLETETATFGSAAEPIMALFDQFESSIKHMRQLQAEVVEIRDLEQLVNHLALDEYL